MFNGFPEAMKRHCRKLSCQVERTEIGFLPVTALSPMQSGTCYPRVLWAFFVTSAVLLHAYWALRAVFP